MTKIILINGPARSGKDTLADYLTETNYRYQKFKFADCMQGLWRGIFSTFSPEYDEFIDYVDGSKKNDIHPDVGCSFRSAMIDFSENYIKPRYGINFFGRLTAAKVENLQYVLGDTELTAVISDSGFEEEAVSLIEKFGAENVLLLKLYRPGYTFDGDSRSYINLKPFGVKTIELDNISIDQLKRDGLAAVEEFVAAS